MSDFSAIAAYGAGQLLANQNESAATQAQRKARQATQKGTAASSSDTASSSDPVDTIQTSPAAGAALSALLKQTNAEAQKQFDAEQLKEALTELHFLQLLGTSLPPDKLAKETTDLAKRIAGIAQDYAGNSGSSSPAAVASATDPATAANNAASSAQTAASTQSAAADAGSTASTASTASSARSAATPPTATAAAAKTDAGTPSAKTASGQSAPATGTAATAPGTSTSSTSTQSTASAGASTPPAAATGADQGTDSAAGFFSQIIGAFKELKKIETRALAELSLDKDPKKRNEAKKYGAEFNDAVLSTEQSATAAGVPAKELFQDTIDVATTTLNISV